MEEGLPKGPNGIMAWLLMGGAGMVGRLMYHAKMVQAGVRKPFSWVLFWDLPIALGAGWVALGIATHFHVAWEVAVSLSIVVSYLGPYSLDTLFDKWVNFKFGKQPQTPDKE